MATKTKAPLCLHCGHRHWFHKQCKLLQQSRKTPEPRKGTPIPAWPFLNRRVTDRDASFDDPGYV